MATLTTITAAVIHKLGETTDDGMLDNVTASINSGLQQMATEFDWPWLVTTTTIPTVSGTQAYALPATCTRIRAISNDDYLLRSVQFNEIIRFVNVPTQRPSAYYAQHDNILIAPTPGAVYMLGLEYVRCENTLSSGSDTVLCPDWYIDIVVVYAALEEARRRRDQVLVNLLEQSKQEWITRIRDNINRSRDLPDILTRPDTF